MSFPIQTALTRPASLAFATLLALALAPACGADELASEGEECVAASQCDFGLVCDFAAEPPVCAPSQSLEPPAPDADVDVDAGPDQLDGGAGDDELDAELPDAEVPDAEVPDAEVPDAEVPDAESGDGGV